VLRRKIAEFVQNSDFGLASGHRSDGTYDRVWFGELLAPDEVAFESDVFLLTKEKAGRLRAGLVPPPVVPPQPDVGNATDIVSPKPNGPSPPPASEVKTLRVFGSMPPEVWNRLGARLLPKLRSGTELKVDVEFVVKVDGALAVHLERDLRQILEDLGLAGSVRTELQ
jgi:hypothetical protein